MHLASFLGWCWRMITLGSGAWTSGSLFTVQSGHLGISAGDATGEIDVESSKTCLQKCLLTAGCTVASYHEQSSGLCQLARNGTVTPVTYVTTTYKLLASPPSPTPVTDASTAPALTTVTTVAPCTEPSTNGEASNACSTGRTPYSVKAAMRLNGNKAVLFSGDGMLLLCLSMDDIKVQHAQPCTKYQFYNSATDPSGIFPQGPDAAAEYIHPTASNCIYFLFLGSQVYCYKHSHTFPFFEPCTEWTSMPITQRFGAGIPSDLDTAVGSRGSWDFTFTKGNILYESVGNSSSGTLEATHHIHSTPSEYRYQPCQAWAVLEGTNPAEYHFFVEIDHYYLRSTNDLSLKGQICGDITVHVP